MMTMWRQHRKRIIWFSIHTFGWADGWRFMLRVRRNGGYDSWRRVKGSIKYWEEKRVFYVPDLTGTLFVPGQYYCAGVHGEDGFLVEAKSLYECFEYTARYVIKRWEDCGESRIYEFFGTAWLDVVSLFL